MNIMWAYLVIEIILHLDTDITFWYLVSDKLLHSASDGPPLYKINQSDN